MNAPEYVERSEILRQKGTDRDRFLRGQVDKYTWIDFGSSWAPSEIQTAFLYAQLEHPDAILARRLALWTRYAKELADWAGARGVELPQVPSGASHAAHLFYMLLPSETARDAFIAFLAEQGIHATLHYHYQALNLSAMGRRFGGRPGTARSPRRRAGSWSGCRSTTASAMTSRLR